MAAGGPHLVPLSQGDEVAGSEVRWTYLNKGHLCGTMPDESDEVESCQVPEAPANGGGDPVRVRVFGTLRSVLGDVKAVEMRLEGRATAHQVLDQLVAMHPALRDKVFTADNRLQGGVNLLVNGRSVRFLNGLDTPLQEGDEVALFPPVGGGQG